MKASATFRTRARGLPRAAPSAPYLRRPAIRRLVIGTSSRARVSCTTSLRSGPDERSCRRRITIVCDADIDRSLTAAEVGVSSAIVLVAAAIVSAYLPYRFGWRVEPLVVLTVATLGASGM